jgi:hypothetical protein
MRSLSLSRVRVYVCTIYKNNYLLVSYSLSFPNSYYIVLYRTILYRKNIKLLYKLTIIMTFNQKI